MGINYYETRNRKNIEILDSMLEELPAFCREYFLGKENTTTSMTRRNYAYDLRIFFDFLSKKVYKTKEIKDITLNDLDTLSTTDLERYLSYLNYYELNGKTLSNNERAKARKLATVRSMYKYFFNKNKLTANTAAKISTPKLHDKEIIRLEVNEVADLINVAEDGSGAEIADKVESGLSEGSAKITSVHKESTNSLEREVRQLKESDPALYQNLTPALLRMIRTAQKYDSSITLETGLTMSVGELSRLIHDAHKDYKDLLTEGLQDEYECIYEERAAVIREKIDEVYGEEYAALKKTERALDDILDRIEDELENAEIALEDAEKIARLLGLDGVEKLRDGGGKITAESVDEVADKIEDAFDGDDEAEEAFEEKLDEVENILERYEFDEDDYVLSAEEAAEISEITGREFARYEDAEEYLDELEDDLDDMKDGISLTKEQKNEIKSLERELKELKKEVKNQLKDDISAVKEELKELKKHKQNG